MKRKTLKGGHQQGISVNPTRFVLNLPQADEATGQYMLITCPAGSRKRSPAEYLQQVLRPLAFSGRWFLAGHPAAPTDWQFNGNSQTQTLNPSI